MYEKKQQEIAKIKDKNKRISKILSDLDQKMEIFEPDLGVIEKPEMLLSVEDDEVSQSSCWFFFLFFKIIIQLYKLFMHVYLGLMHARCSVDFGIRQEISVCGPKFMALNLIVMKFSLVKTSNTADQWRMTRYVHLTNSKQNL